MSARRMVGGFTVRELVSELEAVNQDVGVLLTISQEFPGGVRQETRAKLNDVRFAVPMAYVELGFVGSPEDFGADVLRDTLRTAERCEPTVSDRLDFEYVSSPSTHSWASGLIVEDCDAFWKVQADEPLSGRWTVWKANRYAWRWPKVRP